MLDRDALKQALLAAGANVTDAQMDAALQDAAGQTELLRHAESIYRNMITMDEVAARTLKTPGVVRTWLQARIASWQQQFPNLPAYAPRSSTELKAGG